MQDYLLAPDWFINKGAWQSEDEKNSHENYYLSHRVFATIQENITAKFPPNIISLF